jgi:hypothetical protein
MAPQSFAATIRVGAFPSRTRRPPSLSVLEKNRGWAGRDRAPRTQRRCGMVDGRRANSTLQGQRSRRGPARLRLVHPDHGDVAISCDECLRPRRDETGYAGAPASRTWLSFWVSRGYIGPWPGCLVVYPGRRLDFCRKCLPGADPNAIMANKLSCIRKDFLL